MSAPGWINLADVEPRRQRFLMYPYLPLGVATTFAGDGGLGKSYAALAIASCVTTGSPLPTGESCERGRVLLLSAEDPLAEVIVPRLVSLGADRSRIDAYNFKLERGLVFNEDGLRQLEERTSAVRPRLVIVDPITHFLGDTKDMHRANEVRGVLTRLGSLATRHSCAVLVLAHLNKASKATASQRVLGSVDFRNAVRSLLVAGKLDDQPERGRVIFHDKANGSVIGRPLGFDIKADHDGERGAGQFTWQQTDLTKSEVFEGKASASASPSKVAACRDILHALLENGEPVPSDRAQRVASAGGLIAERTVRRAREQLGLDTIRHADGTTSWRLPTRST